MCLSFISKQSTLQWRESLSPPICLPLCRLFPIFLLSTVPNSLSLFFFALLHCRMSSLSSRPLTLRVYRATKTFILFVLGVEIRRAANYFCQKLQVCFSLSHFLTPWLGEASPLTKWPWPGLMLNLFPLAHSTPAAYSPSFLLRSTSSPSSTYRVSLASSRSPYSVLSLSVPFAHPAIHRFNIVRVERLRRYCLSRACHRGHPSERYEL